MWLYVLCPKQGYTEEQEGFGLLLVLVVTYENERARKGN